MNQVLSHCALCPVLSSDSDSPQMRWHWMIRWQEQMWLRGPVNVRLSVLDKIKTIIRQTNKFVEFALFSTYNVWMPFNRVEPVGNWCTIFGTNEYQSHQLATDSSSTSFCPSDFINLYVSPVLSISSCLIFVRHDSLSGIRDPSAFSGSWWRQGKLWKKQVSVCYLSNYMVNKTTLTHFEMWIANCSSFKKGMTPNTE
jgi:hypothetical protein